VLLEKVFMNIFWEADGGELLVKALDNADKPLLFPQVFFS
jgi:hypothetical protein